MMMMMMKGKNKAWEMENAWTSHPLSSMVLQGPRTHQYHRLLVDEYGLRGQRRRELRLRVVEAGAT